MAQCKRQGCKEFDLLIEEREISIMAERERLAEVCKKLAHELGVIEEKIAEAESTNAALAARHQSLSDEIVESKSQARDVEAQSEFLRTKNQEMNSQVNTGGGGGQENPRGGGGGALGPPRF